MALQDASSRLSVSATTLTRDTQPQSTIAEASSTPLQPSNKQDIYRKIEDRFRIAEHVIKQVVRLIKELEVLAYTVVGFLGVVLILYYALHRQVADMLKELLK